MWVLVSLIWGVAAWTFIAMVWDPSIKAQKKAETDKVWHWVSRNL